MPRARDIEMSLRDNRNYIGEAKAMMKGLSDGDLYRLYDIVTNQLQRSNSRERDKELKAVQKVIEGIKHLDEFKLQRLREGYGSMASNARAKDGNTEKHKRRV